MSDDLARLAFAYGIEPSYISERGEVCPADDATRRALLLAMGVGADSDDAVAASLASAPHVDPGESRAPEGLRCFVPDWLQTHRAWGVSCQLYGLRSPRNCGIGDFEDLGDLAELLAAQGADFIGLNPLHALFYADPARRGPYAPSSRRFLNPFCIAVDRLPGGPRSTDLPDAELARAAEAARASELVDYPQVAMIKQRALDAGYVAFCDSERASGEADAFRAFCTDAGDALHRFALFEALSEAMVAEGCYSGWHTWPPQYQAVDAEAVQQFASENADRIEFHKWLQWVAETQLRRAQDRATAAGMRIGLYLDLAVGAAPDGAETWARPDAVIDQARIGSPPDMFNDKGQDWGLAPLSPAALKAREFEPFEAVLRALMRHAGAARIDHAMGLTRLYWIPADATTGAYVRYPLRDMLLRVANVSQERRCVVIGEDLGTVPPGFRETLSGMEIQGYRVLYFEREGDGSFRPPAAYTHEAIACLSTHDLPPLKGWWRSSDVDEREAAGLLSPEHAASMRSARAHERYLLLVALNDAGILPPTLDPVLHWNAPWPDEIPEELTVAVHAFLARSASRLVAVQLEDMLGISAQTNVPGTIDEFPNWRRKLPLDMADIPQVPLFRAIAEALAKERPRRP